MLMQERSHLTSRSTAQQGMLGLLMGIHWGGRERGRKGFSRCQHFLPDAAAVSTDDASAVSAPTQLDDQLRMLWFLDFQAECGTACFTFPVEREAAAEHLRASDCCIWNMFPSDHVFEVKSEVKAMFPQDKASRVTKHALRGDTGRSDVQWKDDSSSAE